MMAGMMIRTQPFDLRAASTPYNEQYEMQTMQHEQSGLPDTSHEETPLLRGSGSITDAELERRLKALRENAKTGIINTTKMMDTSINPLSEEDRTIQIERVKNLIKSRYPNAHVLQKKSNGYCAFGAKGRSKIDQLKENQGPDYEEEIKRKEKLKKKMKKT